VLRALVVTFVVVTILGWGMFAVCVARAAPDGGVDGGAVRLLPDILRLIRDLARDRTLARSVRWRLAIALLYNVKPINLIPDFIPVIGLVDNLVITAWVLRTAISAVGPDAVLRHWRGTPEGLAVVSRLVRLPDIEAAAVR
jgi:uncharacterized membrane protein YkvA (DUF1232 family)